MVYPAFNFQINFTLDKAGNFQFTARGPGTLGGNDVIEINHKK
jgi:hypothetical protein